MANPGVNKWNASNITSPSYNYGALAVGASVSTTGFKALFIGGAGDLLVYDYFGGTCLFVGVQAGSVLPVLGIGIGTTASGTTASSIVMLG